MDSAPDDLRSSTGQDPPSAVNSAPDHLRSSTGQDPPRLTPSSAASANEERPTAAGLGSNWARRTDHTTLAPSLAAATPLRTRDDLAILQEGARGNRPASPARPSLPRLRTATSVPSSWLQLHTQVNAAGGRRAADDDLNSSSRYTSIRELLLPNSPPSIKQVTPPPPPPPAPADHHHLLSPSRHQHHPVSPDHIPFRNHLLKHAAYAYLRPAASPAPEPRRLWLVAVHRQAQRHPDDDGRSWDDYCDGGGGPLCGGVRFVAGWLARAVRCLFTRVIGRQTTANTTGLDWTETKPTSEHQHHP